MAKSIPSPEKIVSAAYIKMGESPISSFTEEGVPGLVASNLYESTVEDCLSAHIWSFATKRVTMSKLDGQPLPQEYQYGYKLPSDLIRIITVSEGSDDFDLNGDILYSNVDALILEYVYRVDERFFPPYFTKYVEWAFAAEAAIPIAQSEARADYYDGKATAQLKVARQRDRTSSPVGGFKIQGFQRGYTDVNVRAPD